MALSIVLCKVVTNNGKHKGKTILCRGSRLNSELLRPSRPCVRGCPVSTNKVVRYGHGVRHIRHAGLCGNRLNLRFTAGRVSVHWFSHSSLCHAHTHSMRACKSLQKMYYTEKVNHSEEAHKLDSKQLTEEFSVLSKLPSSLTLGS